MNDSLQSKLFNSGQPKRILTLDGGGIRGILTLGMLKKIETDLRQKSGNNDLLLCDHYDLIGGTSTGAIIACGLAIGKSVDEIIELYMALGKEIFGEGRRRKWLKRSWTTIRSFFNENYSSNNLEKYLQRTFKDITLGDTQQIKCGLLINTKRADTYSLWTFTNHPEGKYYGANAHLKLWELCRASSAAPYYFKPKKIELRTRKGVAFNAAFIDGGVSLANNPAWVSFLAVVASSFGFKWGVGSDKILITTLGTGNGESTEVTDKVTGFSALKWAPKLPDLFMVDALEMNQMLLAILGSNLGSTFSIDSQFYDANDADVLESTNKLFSFSRHNVKLTQSYLKELGIVLSEQQVNALKEMDYFENMPLLFDIGKAYAERNIKQIL
jgi:uncharacterized protein